jgi:hypothetical protein
MHSRWGDVGLGSTVGQTLGFWNTQECCFGFVKTFNTLHMTISTLTDFRSMDAVDTSQQQDAPRPCCKWRVCLNDLGATDQDIHPLWHTVKVFDILMLNGTCLTSYTLRKRREVLFNQKGEHRVFEPVPGRMELADLWEGKDASDIRDRLEWVMENR